MKKLVLTFETSRVSVFIYDTSQTCFNERIYCITSRNKSTDKILVRFGTKKQIDSIVSTYHLNKEFHL